MATEEMRGIPFDSRKQLAEDGSMYEDREVFSADIAEYFGYLSSNGICIHEGESLNNQLKITAGTAGTVIFNPGAIKIQGRMGWMENAVEKQAEAGGTKPRYDTAVIELNLSTAERRFIPKIIKGEESDTPTPPELTQTANIYQLGLANIYRTANSTALGTITDTRKDTARCGISKVAVPNLPGVVPADLDPNTFFPSGADLDDYTYPGTYVSEGASVSATLLNCPFTTGGFVLFTQKTAYNNYRQILLGNADECPRYERRRGNGSWSPWVQTDSSGVGVFYQQHFNATAIPAGTSKELASLTLPVGTYVIEGSSSWAIDNRNMYIMAFIRNVTANQDIALNRGVMIAGGGLMPTAVVKLDVESTIKMYAYWSGGNGTATHNSDYLKAVKIK